MQTSGIMQGDSLKRLLQGAVAGAIATAVVGFAWGGWVSGSSARKLAETSATTAVAAALAPICVDKFQHAGDAIVSLAAFKKVSTWEQSAFIEKGGWATMPGSTTADPAVAQACANALDKVT